MVRASTIRRPNQEDATKTISLRIPESLLNSLREEAAAANRSVNAHILWAIEHRRVASAGAVERLLALGGQFPDIEYVRPEMREAETGRRELLDGLSKQRE